MKLAYVSQYFSREFGGPVTNLLMELSKDIEVVNLSSIKKSIQYYNRDEEFESDVESLNKNLKIRRYRTKKRFRGLIYPEGLQDLLLEEKPDIIQSEEFYQPATWVSYEYAKKHDIPFIINCRRNHVLGLKEKIFFLVTNMRSRGVVHGADRLVCLTEKSRDMLTGFFPEIDRERVVVIPNSIDPDAYKDPEPKKFYEKFDIPKGRPVVLSVARIQPSKRIDLLVKAFSPVKKEIEDAILVLIGPWKGNEKEKVEEIIRSLDLQDVVFTGAVSYEDIKNAYAAADVVALSSQVEPFGYCLLEAMCLEKPTVAFGIGGVPEIIIDKKTGYHVPFGDLDSYSERLIDLLSDVTLRGQMGAAGRKRIDERFLLEERAGEMLEMYRELTGK